MSSEVTTIQFKELLLASNLEDKCDRYDPDPENTDTSKGLRCPQCGCSQVKVLESRPIKNAQRRRRECTDCLLRWTTYEYSTDDKENLLIQKQKLSKLLKKIADAQYELAEAIAIIDNLTLENE